ncbi:uncharacterized protein LOC131223492 [Magnolia sinica]|uniref:uncharacterized protein LOC131223492 n=1 Tax=Magnolia sinica TaxID=86752 RepID=UPI00265ADA42|nr:uncharacterized protein LOC131223492 [Magnolia sinica]
MVAMAPHQVNISQMTNHVSYLKRKQVIWLMTLPCTPLAREVVKEYSSLPLAITTLGGVSRGVSNCRLWNNALSQLKTSAPSNIKGTWHGMEDNVPVYQNVGRWQRLFRRHQISGGNNKQRAYLD